MIRMKAPQGSNGISFGGEFFEVDEKGFVEVPGEALADAKDHGFTVAGPEVEKSAEEIERERLEAEKAEELKRKNAEKKAKLQELGTALKDAKAALKADKGNAEKAKAVDDILATIKLIKDQPV